MRLAVVFLLLIVGCWGDMRVSIDQNGHYNITINNRVWLRSSRTEIHTDDRWYSTENNSFPLVEVTTAQGKDPILAAWNEMILTYHLVRDHD